MRKELDGKDSAEILTKLCLSVNDFNGFSLGLSQLSFSETSSHIIKIVSQKKKGLRVGRIGLILVGTESFEAITESVSAIHPMEDSDDEKDTKTEKINEEDIFVKTSGMCQQLKQIIQLLESGSVSEFSEENDLMWESRYTDELNKKKPEPVKVGKKHIIKWSTPAGYNPNGDAVLFTKLNDEGRFL